MKNLLIAFFLISFYSCQENVEDKKQKETITKEVVSDTIKTVDNDMINFLSIGNFGPNALKVIANEINIDYKEYNNHIDSNAFSILPSFESHQFLDDIIYDYLDNNNLHPIEGIYNLIYNAEVGFKVFIYKTIYSNHFRVYVLENKKAIAINKEVEALEKKLKISRGNFRKDEHLIWEKWLIKNYPFNGYMYNYNEPAYIKSITEYKKFNFWWSELNKLRPELANSGVSIEDYATYKQSYAYIETTAKKNNFIINWNANHIYFENSPNSIAEFDGKVIKFIVKGVKDNFDVYPEFEDKIFKASFLKTYPVDGNHSKSNNESNWAGNGSGLIISKQGHIVTNHHVINGAKSIEVEFKNDEGLKKYNAVVVNSDEETDLAILKINDDDFKEFDETPNYNFKSGLADSGEVIYAYGYPMALSAMGKEVKITDGIISSKTGINGDVKTYQISAPIQPGNSGGPLFDEKGNLIGINSSGLSKEIADNVGYTIKTNYLINLIDVLPEKIELPYSHTIRWLSNQKQIKRLSKYTVLIKVK